MCPLAAGDGAGRLCPPDTCLLSASPRPEPTRGGALASSESRRSSGREADANTSQTWCDSDLMAVHGFCVRRRPPGCRTLAVCPRGGGAQSPCSSTLETILDSCGQRPVLATDIEIKMCHQHRHTQLEVSVDISGELCSRG